MFIGKQLVGLIFLANLSHDSYSFMTIVNSVFPMLALLVSADASLYFSPFDGSLIVLFPFKKKKKSPS